MKKIYKRIFFIVAVPIALAACATPIPFFDSEPLNSSDRSKITIRSVVASGSLNPLKQDNNPETNQWTEGKVSLNSQFQGEFTEKGRVFSKEVAPGQYLVSVCPNHQCVQKQIDLKPNTHAIFKFKYNLRYMVIASRAEWTLELERIEDYPFMAASNKSENTIKKIEPNKKRTLDDMQDAEKKCESLGFKRQTEEFGKCILSVAN
jgi:hypothetical protein